jgi:disintegrin and metalloproteinase domain-containing protein 10
MYCHNVLCLNTGDSTSNVYGTFGTDDVFEGVIKTSDEDYTVERANRYFKFDIHADSQFHSIIYRHSAIRLDQFNESLCLSDALHHKLTRRATDRRPWHLGFDGGLIHGQSRRIFGPQANQPPFHQAIDPMKTTCTMYLQADHLFYQKFDADEDAVVEQLTQHVQAVNDIYRSIGISTYIHPCISRQTIHSYEPLQRRMSSLDFHK